MNCPRCGECKTIIIETRNAKSKCYTRRRRKCFNCGYKFTTYEAIFKSDFCSHKRDAGSYESCFEFQEYNGQNCNFCPYRKKCGGM